MIINENDLRKIIRDYLIENIDESSNQAKNARGMGLEYLYALLQPVIVSGANLPVKQIELPHHIAREEELDISLDSDKLKDKGSDIDRSDYLNTDLYTASIEDYDTNDDLNLFDK